MRNGTGRWRPLVARGFGGALLALLFVAVSAAAARSPVPNPIANGGFEQPLAQPLTTCGRLPVSVGRWLPYAQTPGYVPARVTDPRHGGAHGLSVRGPAIPICAAYGVIEDMRRGAVNLDQDFDFRLWIDPDQGTQSQELIVNWTRLNGSPSFAVTENLPAHTVTFSAWGRTRRVHDSLKANVWHRIDLAVSASTDTATLSIDGRPLGKTAPGSPVASGQVTLVLGQVIGFASGLSNFYYDDVGLSG